MLRKFLVLVLVFNFSLIIMPSVLADYKFTDDTTTDDNENSESSFANKNSLGIDFIFSATAEGIANFVENFTNKTALLIKNAQLGICDSTTKDEIDLIILKLRLLKRFLNGEQIIFNLLKNQIPLPFRNWNVNKAIERRDAILARIEQLRQELRDEGKSEEEIESILESRGAYRALEQANNLVLLAEEAARAVETALMMLESAKILIDYICNAQPKAIVQNSTKL